MRVACVEGQGVGRFGLPVLCRRPQAGVLCQERPLDFPQHSSTFEELQTSAPLPLRIFPKGLLASNGLLVLLALGHSI